jgi:hypothetical protein
MAYALTDGWSVEWDLSPANTDRTEWCHARAQHDVCIGDMYSDRVLNSATMTWNLKLFCNNFHQLGEHSCDINACDVKYVGDCISELAFVRDTLFDPAFGGLSGHYPTGQGIIPFEVHGALKSGLAYLRRCNSGWFYHNHLIREGYDHCSLKP